MAPEITVLLPSHDRADALELAVRSVLVQSFEDFELFVVLDGCTDDSAQRMRAFEDTRLRVFDMPKAPGYGHANRALALAEARGRFVAYQQDDDLWFPDHLELLHRQISRAGARWGHSRSFFVRDSGWAVPHLANATVRFALRQMRQMPLIASSSIMHPREMLDRTGGWDSGGESEGDWRLWLKMVAETGAGPLVCQRAPSVFHFNSQFSADANWPRFLGGLTAAGLPGAIPEALHLVRDGSAVRPTIWNLMEEGGRAWTIKLRRLFDTVLDQAAWATASDPFYR